MRKKFQTTVYADGKSEKLHIGWTAENRLEDDMEWERNRFSKLALDPRTARQIQTTEVTTNTVVAVYECGTVKIIHWVEEN